MTVFTVFLKPLLLGDIEGYQCGWGILVVKGSLKVILEGDYLGFCGLPQAAYGREGDGIYVLLSL